MVPILKTILIAVARIIPVLLVVGLSVVWSHEKGLRLDFQQKAVNATTKLHSVEKRNVRLVQELEASRESEARMKEEKLNLIAQLGQRDDHIRRLLAEMVQILSGMNPVDLGKLSIHGDSEIWEPVKEQLDNATIEVEAPVIQEVNIDTPAPVVKMPQMLPTPSFISGSPQMQIEERPVSAIAPQTMALDLGAAGESTRQISNITIKEREEAVHQELKNDLKGEVLVVNREHNFVVINRGMEHGVIEGSDMAIFRDNRKLGSVRIETAYQKISAATVVEGAVGDFSTGDGVIEA